MATTARPSCFIGFNDREIALETSQSIERIVANPSTTDRNNRVTQFEYDKLDRLLNEQWKDVAKLVASSAYDYDLAGRLETLTHHKANTTTIANYGLIYDAGDRLTQNRKCQRKR